MLGMGQKWQRLKQMHSQGTRPPRALCETFEWLGEELRSCPFQLLWCQIYLKPKKDKRRIAIFHQSCLHRCIKKWPSVARPFFRMSYCLLAITLSRNWSASLLNFQLIPNLSTSIPKHEDQGVLDNGMMTWPPRDKWLKYSSSFCLSSMTRLIRILFPFTSSPVTAFIEGKMSDIMIFPPANSMEDSMIIFNSFSGIG